MSGIVEFLRARLDEDEAIAEACRSDFGPYGPHGAVAWELHDNGNVWWPDTNSMVATGQWGDLEDEVGKHIARFDPARALREVAAMRWVLGEHNVYSVARAEDPLAKYHQSDRACVGCGSDRQEDWLVEDINDCPILRALATIYFDHPDYRQEWTP